MVHVLNVTSENKHSKHIAEGTHNNELEFVFALTSQSPMETHLRRGRIESL